MNQDENKPLSIGQFIGYSLLFSIPFVGFICTIVFACGTVKNTNLKNWSRAILIMAGIVIVIYVLLIILGFSTFFIMNNSSLY